MDMRLRAHHICCVRFWSNPVTGRGKAFEETEERIRQALRPESGVSITVVEGIDELCNVCPDCDGERCVSRNGDEEKVRKWDSILLSELGVSYDTTFSAGEWESVVKEKVPLKLCQKCKYKVICSVDSSC